MSFNLREASVTDYLSALSERTPTPGGGAVAGTSLATAAAIAHMAIVFSKGRESLAAFDAQHDEALIALKNMQARGLELAEADARAYAQLNTLWKLPKDDPSRTTNWDDAVEAAIAAPAQVMETGVELLALLERLIQATSPMLRSDLAVAAITAEAAIRSAAWNVRINLPSVGNPDLATEHRSRMESRLDSGQRTAAAVEAGCQSS